MNVFVIGSGGREHALAWKISQSPLLDKLFIAPGNAGTELTGTNVPVNVSDFNAVADFVLENHVDMVVVGPEVPLVNGIRDYFDEREDLSHVSVIGPSKAGARLEGSKDFAKQFMQENNIPTAAYKTFRTGETQKGVHFMQQLKSPYVLKADGLAAGKGVIISENIDEAAEHLDQMLEHERFGEAGRKVVIEEFLTGIEVSVFVLTDGKNYLILPEAKDYKRIGEGDTGPNTGGMGCISPVPFADDAFMGKVENRIIRPTIEGLKKEKILYQGFIFFGLMNVEGNPYMIEYNCRMGDPEAEVVIPRIKTDLLELFAAIRDQKLSDHAIETDSSTAATVFLVSGGYPGSYEKGKEITGLEQAAGSIIFHAGSKTTDGKIVTTGGRVLAITSLAANINNALINSYQNAERIDFEGKYYRRDLGLDLK
ncbi:MAG: phosphoribosylamine--glycine ligase [Bacteroidales bacterium]